MQINNSKTTKHLCQISRSHRTPVLMSALLLRGTPSKGGAFNFLIFNNFFTTNVLVWKRCKHINLFMTCYACLSTPIKCCIWRVDSSSLNFSNFHSLRNFKIQLSGITDLCIKMADFARGNSRENFQFIAFVVLEILTKSFIFLWIHMGSWWSNGFKNISKYHSNMNWWRHNCYCVFYRLGVRRHKNRKFGGFLSYNV